MLYRGYEASNLNEKVNSFVHVFAIIVASFSVFKRTNPRFRVNNLAKAEDVVLIHIDSVDW